MRTTMQRLLRRRTELERTIQDRREVGKDTFLDKQELGALNDRIRRTGRKCNFPWRGVAGLARAEKMVRGGSPGLGKRG